MRDLDKRTGYREITRHVIINNMPGYPGTETKFVLCRMRAADLVDDLFGFVMDFDTQVDVAARTRRA